MKVLLDENFPLPLLEALLGASIDAEHMITLGLRGTADKIIRARLDAEAVLFLTQDKEFLMATMPAAGWVIVSRVKQSRTVPDRVAVWLRAVQDFLSTPVASRILELVDDGRLLPWFDPGTGKPQQ